MNKNQLLESLSQLSDKLENLEAGLDASVYEASSTISRLEEIADIVGTAKLESEQAYTYAQDTIDALNDTQKDLQALQAQLDTIKEQVEKDPTNDDKVENTQ